MNRYLVLRKKYLPKRIATIFVLESPPASGKYFYNPKGRVSEPLFSAMMKIIKIKPLNKLVGLMAFQKAGYIIVDSTYSPVNHLTNARRNNVIRNDYPHLVSDLKKLSKKLRPRIILVKANVCRLLENWLLKDGFNVINKGVVIPFPAFGKLNKFYKKVKNLI